MNTKTKQTTAADAPEAPHRAICYCSHCRCNRSFVFKTVDPDGHEEHVCEACSRVYTADKSAHTPGPWKVVRDSDEAEFSVRSDAFKTSNMMGDYQGVIVCDISRAIGGEFSRAHAVPEAEANARLIAAAPELLQACKDALRALTPTVGARNPTSYLILQDAIAKAEGQ